MKTFLLLVLLTMPVAALADDAPAGEGDPEAAQRQAFVSGALTGAGLTGDVATTVATEIERINGLSAEDQGPAIEALLKDRPSGQAVGILNALSKAPGSSPTAVAYVQGRQAGTPTTVASAPPAAKPTGSQGGTGGTGGTGGQGGQGGQGGKGGQGGQGGQGEDQENGGGQGQNNGQEQQNQGQQTAQQGQQQQSQQQQESSTESAPLEAAEVAQPNIQSNAAALLGGGEGKSTPSGSTTTAAASSSGGLEAVTSVAVSSVNGSRGIVDGAAKDVQGGLNQMLAIVTGGLNTTNLSALNNGGRTTAQVINKGTVGQTGGASYGVAPSDRLLSSVRRVTSQGEGRSVVARTVAAVEETNASVVAPRSFAQIYGADVRAAEREKSLGGKAGTAQAEPTYTGHKPR